MKIMNAFEKWRANHQVAEKVLYQTMIVLLICGFVVAAFVVGGMDYEDRLEQAHFEQQNKAAAIAHIKANKASQSIGGE